MNEVRRLTGARVLAAAGVALIAAWAAWWAVALVRLELPGCDRTWAVFPAFGADFWTQPELAALVWGMGKDPYANTQHLFHYPPLVIRLFQWVRLFGPETNLRIWITLNALLVVGGTLVACRVRERLGLEPIPRAFAVGAVLVSFPVVYQLERSNFDLISLAVVLLALPLLERRRPGSEIVAGCLLAIAPWVKLYPGVLGLGLLALRRWRAFAAFVVAAALIGVSMPRETLRSFEVLGVAMQIVRRHVLRYEYGEWAHSLSAAYVKIAQAAPWRNVSTALLAVPSQAVAGVLIAAALLPVAWIVYRRSRDDDALAYPLLLWMMAVGSCAPIIANDYSLAFLPIAAVAAGSARDPRWITGAFALSLLWWQPFALPIPAGVVLVLKLLCLAAVGGSIVRRASHSGDFPGSSRDPSEGSRAAAASTS